MNRIDCPCKRTECERHGNCDVCKAYHHGKTSGKSLTRCEKLVQCLQINWTLYLSKFPSAALSSVDVATATPPSSVLQNENLSCTYSPVIWKTLY